VAVNPDSALRAEAHDRGWEIRDFRTGRKALKVGIPVAVGASALAGGVTAAVTIRRRQHPQVFDRRRRGAARGPNKARLVVSARRSGAA
jgi:hypothetical protein